MTIFLIIYIFISGIVFGLGLTSHQWNKRTGDVLIDIVIMTLAWPILLTLLILETLARIFGGDEK